MDLLAVLITLSWSRCNPGLRCQARFRDDPLAEAGKSCGKKHYRMRIWAGAEKEAAEGTTVQYINWTKVKTYKIKR